MSLLDKPNIYLFRTCGKCYIYDVCNNIILRITSNCYEYINKMLQNSKIESKRLISGCTPENVFRISG